ncbi:MAG TPA: 4-hydroxythreonine-4-phosphate dehydrogenase PdxA [Hyphomicrobiaceae bacterium]|jgi:4-hydroxythreonine-4-phosphate dehydrogenase|nr:4-hydroxythreonine-4-phosphate dehydrogenase PdxA [Hyphomicrobiaceae bacterium]
MDRRPKIAVATGDAAGIGPEISIKSALDPAVRSVCTPILVSDPALLERHAKACGLPSNFHVIDRADGSDLEVKELVVLDPHCPEAASVGLGEVTAGSGRASLAFARAAIKVALAGEVDAVVAAPQNQKAIALTGIAFDGYPSFVARETGLDPHDVFLMLCFGSIKIAHCTLHVGVKQAVALITPERVRRVISATDRALKRLGNPAPAIYVGGLNPHAGEDGMFGSEDQEIVKPAIDQAAADGIRVSGPYGADTMFHKKGADAFIVMLHDQGHIAAKLQAPHATAGLTIGSPILFSSVAHGTGHDIVGKGVASPRAMIEAISRLAGVQEMSTAAG